MPVGPDVDLPSVLSPLIDGSYVYAQGQAAVMAGVKVPAQDEGTAPIRGTAPLPVPGTAPLGLNGQPPAAPPPPPQVPPPLVQALVQRVQAGLPTTQLARSPEVERMLAERFKIALTQAQVNVPPGGQEILWRAVLDELLGFGPLEPLLRDDSISEIMVNGPGQVWIERRGHLVESGITFHDDEHVMRV